MVHKKVTVSKIALQLCLFVVGVLCVIPIAVMLLDSFKTSSEVVSNSYGLPRHPTIDNFTQLFSIGSGTITRALLNSIIVSSVTTVVTLLLSALAAYAFAKFRFRGRNVIFLLLVSSMMIPGEITLPAIYLMFSKAGMLNSYAIQILPAIGNVFCLFMLKQYMESVPDSLIEAARIDGASYTQIFWKIMLPMVRPALGALAILIFLGKWNDYLWPSVLLTKKEVMPIAQVLPTLNVSNSVMTIPWNIVMAGCTIVTIPIIVVFLIFQEQFMNSVAMGAVKE